MSLDIAKNVIEGNPTKTFFIEMITRDISIRDAILDLLDNSIDGASKINPHNYEGLFVEIIIDKDKFIVKDNCGGFSLETAKKYAFRFGRPDDAPDTHGSVGRFGIGMKRALFKIGKYFEVESKHTEDHFQVSVDVNTWRHKKKSITTNEITTEVEDWDFSYEDITIESSNLEENGTYIEVSQLYDEVSELFNDNEFLTSLRGDIERLLNFSLEKGIRITLNGEELSGKNIQIFNDESTPYMAEGVKDKVRYKVIGGLGVVGDPSKSGWYIYCNDRLVLEADKSEITGWGTSGIPKWHIDHVMFRGIVFLDSDETINLPLTTTKKGIDATSDIYKFVHFFMREAMGNIMPFFKLVTKLGNEANPYRELLGETENKISVVEMKSTDLVIAPRKFVAPVVDQEAIATKKESVRISYDVKKDWANVARTHSKSKSLKELGETTFEYYIKMESLNE
ncbi:ATP-binding protein [Flavobacterium sp. XS2P12]|uniref:ATP-binding protein n=1 Tax=Flavobacterium melibiosi TaxID=3398734 RepID=UPI003A835733